MALSCVPVDVEPMLSFAIAVLQNMCCRLPPQRLLPLLLLLLLLLLLPLPLPLPPTDR